MLKQIELELQVAIHFAVAGDVERAAFHIELSKKYLLELAKATDEAQKQERELNVGSMRYWRNKATGRCIGTDEQPSGEWEEITKAQHRQIVEAAKE